MTTRNARSNRIIKIIIDSIIITAGLIIFVLACNQYKKHQELSEFNSLFTVLYVMSADFCFTQVGALGICYLAADNLTLQITKK